LSLKNPVEREHSKVGLWSAHWLPKWKGRNSVRPKSINVNLGVHLSIVPVRIPCDGEVCTLQFCWGSPDCKWATQHVNKIVGNIEGFSGYVLRLSSKRPSVFGSLSITYRHMQKLSSICVYWKYREMLSDVQKHVHHGFRSRTGYTTGRSDKSCLQRNQSALLSWMSICFKLNSLGLKRPEANRIRFVALSILREL